MSTTTAAGPDVRRNRFWVEATVVAVLVVAVVPIAWTLLLSFLPNRAIVSSQWQWPFWLGNYERVLRDGVFVAQIANSVAIVVGTVLICLVVGSLAGYAISRLRPPRWIVVPALIIAGFVPLIPPMTLVPGLYVLLAQLGVLGSVWGLILVNAFLQLPFAALLMSSYFSAVPEELREAGLMDGASEWRVFLHVMVPVVRPGLAAVGVFSGIMAWNEFQMGLTLTSGGATAPVTVGIAGLLQPFAVTWGELSAAGTLAAVPIILMAVFANRQIVAGLTSGAVKG
ncbi:carbohydrate ABC transporter permease [Agromyces tropicus]|uniref:Carbohydrate ABC transporter permease n=1 Tax=Agromyces tropicus TaxID=555371 RepID=A0ABN2UVH0_9MICO